MRSRYAFVSSTGETFLVCRCSASAATSRFRISLDAMAMRSCSNLLAVEMCGLGDQVRIAEGGPDARKRQPAELARQRQHRTGNVGGRFGMAVGNLVAENLARQLLDGLTGYLCHRILPKCL